MTIVANSSPKLFQIHLPNHGQLHVSRIQMLHHPLEQHNEANARCTAALQERGATHGGEETVVH